MEVASARSAGGLSARTLAALMGLLAAALVGLVAWSVVLGLQVWDKQRLEAERHEVMHAARQQTVDLFSLDYRKPEQGINRILDGATGNFRDTFANGTQVFEQYLPTTKSITTPEIHSAGLTSMDADSAEVLVAADTLVRTEKQKDPVVRHYRMAWSLERHDGRWLVSDLRFIP